MHPPQSRAAESLLPGLEWAPDFVLTDRSYQVRYARAAHDLEAICRLRFEIFNLELGEGLDRSYRTGLDRDRFDAQCQHILVEHHSGEVVGTYRVQIAETALQGHGFYSAGEFDLAALPDGFLAKAIEVGRACIAKAHRNRAVLLMLWKALAAYREHHRRRYFMGCNSLTSQDPGLGLRTHAWLRQHGYLAEWSVPPRAELTCTEATPPADPPPPVRIPPLFAAYLRYGAKVCSPPAIDREFGTLDFLTVLDIASMDREVYRRFRR